MRTDSRLILQAPTGSGKSTQIPQMLLDHGLLGDGEVVILQPRRLATRMLAARVAQERGVQLGGEVGYQIRFDRVVSDATKIRFVTEGVLLRQLLKDRDLRGISALIFDEFHERHLYGDITLARALQLQETSRVDLKIIVMSATLDSGALEKYLTPCALLTSAGRTFPVEIEYLDKPVRAEDYAIWDLAADELQRIARTTDGDFLIFMPGAYEIARTVQGVRARTDFLVFPLHGEMPAAEQDAAVARYEKRKVVVATNVAETSLTIDGVRVVIDSGVAKIARYDPNRGINTLLVEKISRASAEQRAGRAGRTAPGRCVRLWTQSDHAKRPAQELPEIKRLDLAEVVLTLKASGIDDVRTFRWLEAPEPRSLERAETLLTDLGAVDAAGAITAIGRRMLAFPIHPRYARMLLAAEELGCVRPVALISALTQGRNIFQRAEGKQMREDREDFLGEKADSDFFILMRAWRFAVRNNFQAQRCRALGINAAAAREAGQLFEQFLKIARDEKLDVSERETSDEALRRCVLAGFSDQVAVRLDAGTLRCALVHGRRGVLARESVVQHSHLLVASEVREVQGRDVQVLLTLATAIEENWLRELFSADFSEVIDNFFDTTTRRVLCEQRVVFRGLVLRSERSENVSPAEAAAVLAEHVLDGTCPLTEWDNSIEQWILRVNRLAEWMPELELPTIGDDEKRLLIEQICEGATTYKQIKDRPVRAIVLGWLAGAKRAQLDRFAPERIALPREKKAKVLYAPSSPPSISVRIQELFGLETELAIANGRVPIVINVLAPNNRPVQVTQNLANFWKETYPKIKNELQRKYPKHEWR
ncbi:MAG: ATP-dependent helicase HrpB [Verrucomicrobiota bacterium]|nr:ATP-dependent helicase HrpB [Verrucomicrobiota bacterium]